MITNNELCLKVFYNRSILLEEDGTETIFQEGKNSVEAVSRNRLIRDHLENGFLEKRIAACRKGKVINPIDPIHTALLDRLVHSITSEVGRALIGLTILQCCIKAIAPEQCIRLHKGSMSEHHFSWVEGLPMRSLDRNYITPILRKYDLVRLNADGFMMTRSLAENYPYSPIYKANLRGAKQEWIKIVDLLEKKELNAVDSLEYLISLLLNNSNEFNKLADKTIQNLSIFLSTNPQPESIFSRISTYVSSTNYSARVFEIAIHSLMQSYMQLSGEDGFVKPLTQMRSANKKHGNIGDVEIVNSRKSNIIIEAWDAKYGKPYLRDELEELFEKLEIHTEIKIAGFIVDKNLDKREDILRRKQEIEDFFNVKIYLFDFTEWVRYISKRSAISSVELYQLWMTIFVESICQKRRDMAPIDEPSFEWVRFLNETFAL